MANKVRILSIDGGGIRGIIPAVILEYLEQELKKKSGNANAVIQDYFDMIAGTSTGGILTCFYLHPARLPAEKAVGLYADNGGDIFKSRFLGKIVSFFTSKYPATELEKALNSTFGEYKLSQVSKWSLVTAYDIVNRKSVLFTVPEAKKYPQRRDFYLKDIARATSAAPTYFTPASIKSMDNVLHCLVDGAMFANDPSLCALVEARKTDFGKCNCPTIKDVYIVSIGTGKKAIEFDPKKASKWGIAGWAVPVVDILMTASPEVVSYQLKQLFEVSGCSDSYVRLQPELGDANPEMDDASKNNIKNLKKAGSDYITQNRGILDKIVEELIKP
jgi:patatin-like phospholipase/acyl hydrolase